MKFTSIVFAALVAATQFSSTFAQSNLAAEITSLTTAYNTQLTSIDVSQNDMVLAGPLDLLNIAYAFDSNSITEYTLHVTSPSLEGGTVTVNTVAGAVDTITYKPKDNFEGSDTFQYTFTVTPSKTYGSTLASNKATVTVNVSPPDVKTPPVVATPVVKQTFDIPDRVSTGNAVKYNHVGLPNIVAVTPGTPDTDSFNAIVKPVFGGSAGFAANTSTEAVNNMFAKSWESFIKFWRGGN
jgi:hypothetical protein